MRLQNAPLFLDPILIGRAVGRMVPQYAKRIEKRQNRISAGISKLDERVKSAAPGIDSSRH